MRPAPSGPPGATLRPLVAHCARRRLRRAAVALVAATLASSVAPGRAEAQADRLDEWKIQRTQH